MSTIHALKLRTGQSDVETTANDLGMPIFNRNPHLFVDAEMPCFTISARFNGKCVTFAFVARSDGTPECVDIKYHHSMKLRTPNAPDDMRKMAEQRLVVFDGGHNGTMKNGRAEGTLTALLLHPDHYQETK